MRTQFKAHVAMGLSLIVGATTLGVAPAAWVVSPSDASISTESVVESLDLAGNLVLDPVDLLTSPLGDIVLEGGSVSVPVEPTQGIGLNAAGGEGNHIGIPDAAQAHDAQNIVDGSVSYLSENSSSTVIVAQAGVQVLTTIANRGAPTRYDYPVELRPGQTLAIDASGLPSVIDTHGQTVIGISAPWAKDAAGKDVFTHYEVKGDTLTQVIDHSSSVSVAYPVVADPLFIPFWVLKCLAGIGIKQTQITAIMSSGTPWAVVAGLGRGALACFGW